MTPVVAASELESLHTVADAIRDEVEENSYTIDYALDLHPAYGDTGRIASDMIRSLVLHGARRHASLVGLVPTPAMGGMDLVWSEERVYRKYRIKKAEKLETGDFRMLVDRESRLLLPNSDSLIAEEQWVIGFTVTPLRTIDEVFAAEVVGVTDTKVGRLRFGPIILLGHRTTPQRVGRFVSDDDEMLPGFEDDVAASKPGVAA